MAAMGGSPEASPPPAVTPPPWRHPAVAGAGLTSALGDLSYESATVILPGFLAALGLSPALLGVVEGLADAMASLARLLAAPLAARTGSRKALVILGYALTPLGQVLMALTIGWPLLLTGRVLAWLGRGLRGPLRDAILLQSVPSAMRGRSIGLHRALDSLGAVVGPLLGVWLLHWGQRQGWQAPDLPFRVSLWWTVLPGVLAVLVFTLLVHDKAGASPVQATGTSHWQALPGPFRQYLLAVAWFGCGDFSHTLLILAATQLLTPAVGLHQAATLAAGLYVLRNLTQVLAAYPVGVANDRMRPVVVLRSAYLLGTVTALLTSLAFLLPPGLVKPVLVILFLCGGAFMAAQEATEAVLSAQLLPADSLAYGLSILGGVNGIAKLAASALVGICWSVLSPAAAFSLAAMLMTCGIWALKDLSVSVESQAIP